jgi:hypothetical protein
MLNTTKSQIKAFKKVFKTYEDLIGYRNLSYRLMDTIPDLIISFPGIILEMEDKTGIFKKIIDEKLEERRSKC